MPVELRRAKPPDADFLVELLADDEVRRFLGPRTAAARDDVLEELGLHRLELEIYAFNERACAHAERVGFVREGQKRKAYLKDGDWADSVLYALIPEDLD